MPFLNYKPLKLQLRVFLADDAVAVVTYSFSKMITMCSPMVGQFFDTMIAVSIDKVWYPQTHGSQKNSVATCLIPNQRLTGL